MQSIVTALILYRAPIEIKGSESIGLRRFCASFKPKRVYFLSTQSEKREGERESALFRIHPSNRCHRALAAFNPTAIYPSVSIHPSPLLSLAGPLKVTDTQDAKPDGQPHGRGMYHSVSTPL